ncbi:hypothetical protein ADUPG1_006494, partial [Aduncisulcus paluster]
TSAKLMEWFEFIKAQDNQDLVRRGMKLWFELVYKIFKSGAQLYKKPLLECVLFFRYDKPPQVIDFIETTDYSEAELNESLDKIIKEYSSELGLSDFYSSSLVGKVIKCFDLMGSIAEHSTEIEKISRYCHFGCPYFLKPLAESQQTEIIDALNAYRCWKPPSEVLSLVKSKYWLFFFLGREKMYFYELKAILDRFYNFFLIFPKIDRIKITEFLKQYLPYKYDSFAKLNILLCFDEICRDTTPKERQLMYDKFYEVAWQIVRAMVKFGRDQGIMKNEMYHSDLASSDCISVRKAYSKFVSWIRRYKFERLKDDSKVNVVVNFCKRFFVIIPICRLQPINRSPLKLSGTL